MGAGGPARRNCSSTPGMGTNPAVLRVGLAGPRWGATLRRGAAAVAAQDEPSLCSPCSPVAWSYERWVAQRQSVSPKEAAAPDTNRSSSALLLAGADRLPGPGGPCGWGFTP
ncbi:hypothetical protein NDU88_004664 [Pleurodeles waltl]|uniref:Uncharacterized protein n=1 Tax=Pleurodeles waltl TaxID=8319 RepID=A0AAV7PDH1_PLEWA|nr:hypothetical protein NDU88_004664 [Pleurodeles waltl]